MTSEPTLVVLTRFGNELLVSSMHNGKLPRHVGTQLVEIDPKWMADLLIAPMKGTVN